MRTLTGRRTYLVKNSRHFKDGLFRVEAISRRLKSPWVGYLGGMTAATRKAGPRVDVPSEYEISYFEVVAMAQPQEC